ncbi:MAG: hypothetical protein IKG27_01430 [Bacilli bacterium]|nr:hypothetical protein [Bacilli bacterium]
MLEINIGSKKGILFVRLYGCLNKETTKAFDKKVVELLYKIGVNNMVLNIKNLKQIDNYGIEKIKKCYEICDKSYICINLKQINLIKKLKWVIKEEDAINLINT